MRRLCGIALTLSIALGARPAPAQTSTALPAITPAKLADVLAAIRAPGATAVLVNVWATWCDPCREEMPDILRFYRKHKAKGLRLVLISADDEDNLPEARKFLASHGVDFPSLLKVDKDQIFIDGLEPKWSGALPASFLYDARAKKRKFWSGVVTLEALDQALSPLLMEPRTKKRRTP